MMLPTCCRAITVALLLTSCTPTPPQQTAAKPACGVGSDAKGIAAGFFALFQDRPECF